jgi:hypothetical protein
MQGGVQAGALGIEGSGAVLVNSTANRVSRLAANVVGPVTLFDASPLTISTVSNTFGIFTHGHPLSIQTFGQLTLEQSVIVGGSQVTLRAPSIREGPHVGITADRLLILDARSVDLNQRANSVKELAASITGHLTFDNDQNLVIGAIGDVSGIQTFGGNVVVQAHGILTVAAPVDTHPGSGGNLSILGKTNNVHVKVQPILGAGNVTFVAD